MQYDYLIVGAGLFGAVFACEAVKAGKTVLVVDKRPHIAGMYIQKMWKVFMYINMVPIFFIPTIEQYGIM